MRTLRDDFRRRAIGGYNGARMDSNLPQTGEIDADITCVACEYNLRGLQSEGLCPECGLAVAESMDRERRWGIQFGPGLGGQSVAWLYTTAAACVGEVLLAIVPFISVVLLLPRLAASPQFQIPRWYLVSIALAFGGMFLMVWFITRVTAGEFGPARGMRLAVRALFALWLLTMGIQIVQVVQDPQPRSTSTVLATIAQFISAVVTGLFFGYMTTLAGRLRLFRIRRICQILAASSILMILAVIQSTFFIDVSLPVNLPSPELPILGPIIQSLHSVWAVFSPSADWDNWRNLLQYSMLGLVWSVSAVSVLLVFAVALIRLGMQRRDSR